MKINESVLSNNQCEPSFTEILNMTTHVGYNRDQHQHLSSSTHAAVGGFSGSVVRALLQPLDVVKIRFQLQVEPTHGRDAGLYKGVLQALNCIVKKEGITALWKGHVPAQVLSVSYGVGQFWSYAYLTKYAIDVDWEITGGVQMGCGAVAGMIGTLASMPFDIARTRLVAQSSLQYKGVIDVMQQILLTDGVFGLWRGLLPTLAMTMPYSAIKFRCYTLVHNVLSSLLSPGEGLLGTSADISCAAISGSFAGVVAKTLVYPLDVLKKRRQIKGAEVIRKELGKVAFYKNTLDCIICVTKDEGVKAWFKGLWPSIVKSGAVTGLLFVVYESTCKVFVMYYTNQR